MPYRWIYLGLGLLLVAVVALGIALNPEGSSDELPEVVESISPGPGDLVVGQAVIEVDLKAGYEMTMTVDGWPAEDASHVPQTGVYRWAPSALHPITEWTPGEHTVTISWDTVTGLPDRGSYEWTFRTG